MAVMVHLAVAADGRVFAGAGWRQQQRVIVVGDGGVVVCACAVAAGCLVDEASAGLPGA